MENEDVNILELFKTNPKKAWEIVNSRPGEPINKEEFFKDLMSRKAEVEKRKQAERDKAEQDKKEEG